MQMEASTSEQGDGEADGEEDDAVNGSPEIRLVPNDSAAGTLFNSTYVLT